MADNPNEDARDVKIKGKDAASTDPSQAASKILVSSLIADYKEYCCICNDVPSSKAPGNTICIICYMGARYMITLLNEADDGAAGPHDSESTGTKVKGISDGFERVREMQERNKHLEEKVSYLDAEVALREGILTDILVKPGKGPPIPAHRALLAAKSGTLRTMLISHDCKAAAQDFISFPELSHDELKCLLEFFYSGSLPAPLDNDCSSFYYALLKASDKYDIPFLRKQCRSRILKALQPSNALEALEVSQICSDAELKEEIIELIVDHAEEVVCSAGYEEFASRNAHLSIDITRALLRRDNY